ncbi:MAG: cobalamin B12-binding domain-containing protein [Desulfobacter sp.]|nr:MAG: cobalamin B12-binding domain-containing protein [Desulfobacter sp.]
MNSVVLLQPPIQEFYLTHKRTIPYGLCSIAASLEQAGFETKIIDGLTCSKSKVLNYPKPFEYLNEFYGQKDGSLFSLFHEFRHFGYSHEHLANQVRRDQPFVVGISSLFTTYCDQTIETALAVKRFFPKAYIVAGGHHPTAFPEHMLQCKAIDFVLRGDGERSMTKLCNGSVAKNISRTKRSFRRKIYAA